MAADFRVRSKVIVRRTWKRDGAWNEMPLNTAIQNIRAQDYTKSHKALSDALLRGEQLETKHAIFQVPQ